MTTQASDPRPGDQDYARKIDRVFDEGVTMADAERIMTEANGSPERWRITARVPGLKDALAKFQAAYPTIAKGSEGEIKGVDKNGRPYSYKYNYANLADVSEVVLPLLGHLGLSWSCKPTWRDGGFWLDYELAHGPSGETSGGSWPLPDPTKTGPQQVGSALTYARRYAFQSVTGIAPAEDDDDAAEAQRAYKRRQEREDAEWERSRQARPQAQQAQAQPAQQAPQAQQAAGPQPGYAATVDKRIAAEMAAAKQRGVALPLDWYPGARDALEHAGPMDRPSPFGGTPWTEVLDRAYAASEEAHGNRSPHEELQARMAAATSWEQLEAARLSFEEARHLLTEREQSDLETFWQERSVKLPRPEPTTPPMGGSDLDPWATATPVTPSDHANAAADAVTAALAKDDQLGKVRDYEDYRAIIRNTDATEDELRAVNGMLDGAYERGEITAEEASNVASWLTSRPTMAPTTPDECRDGLLWLVETAATEAELDEVREAANDWQAKKLLPIAKGNKVFAAIAAKRVEWKKASK